jgi:broad specificity phosphatase PhoE
MTTTIVLIRHGAHDLLGRKIAGRMAGVGPNPTGHAQARALRERLAH